MTSLALEMQKRGLQEEEEEDDDDDAVASSLCVDTVAEETVRQFVHVFGQRPGSMVRCDYPERGAIFPPELWDESTLPVHR